MTNLPPCPAFSKSTDGLVPVIVQDYKSDQILMLAYLNQEAWEISLKTKLATYWSRSRQSIWVKGEISKNTQEIKDILIDCDLDTVIFKVKQNGGVACHNGYRSCFYRKLTRGLLETIDKTLMDPKQLYN